MSDRENTKDTGTTRAPQQRNKAHQSNNQPYVHKPKPGGKKPGKDRRLQIRSRQFDENLHRKMDGLEVPKTLRKSKEDKMPVSPLYLGIFLFLVIGSAFF